MPVGVFPMADNEIRAGLIFGPCDYQYAVKSVMTLETNTGDGDATYGHSAELYSLFAPDSIDLALGAILQVSSGFDGEDGTWTGFYDGPCAPFGGLSAGGDSFRGTVAASATFKNLRLYAMEYGLLRVMFDGVDVDLGSGVVSLGPSIDAESQGIGPNYVPVFGIPPTVSGGCSAGRANLTPWFYDPCDPDNADGFDWETSVSQKVSGGWRWNDGTGWKTAKVKPYVGAATESYGDLLEGTSFSSYAFSYVGRDFFKSRSYSTCGSFVFTPMGPDPCTGQLAPAYRDGYKVVSDSANSSGSVTLIPNLAKSLNRFAPGYAKLLRRGWFPETRATLSSSTTTSGITSSTLDTPTVHPGLGNDFLGLLRDVDAAVLDCFDTPSFAPSQSGLSNSHNESFIYRGTNPYTCQGMLCPPPNFNDPPTFVGCIEIYREDVADNHSHSEGTSFPSFVGPSGSYQGHAEPLARYCATWPNPFWSLFSHKQDWYLQGTNAPWAPDPDDPTSVGYWGPIRTQMLRNAELPGLPSTRSDMIGDPYYDWAYTPVFNAYTGGLPWLGISRFKVREVVFPELVQLTNASSQMFSCPDDSCEVSVSGGNVVLTPNEEGTLTLDVDLVRADCFPYYGLLLAKNVRFQTLTNVDSLKGSLRSSLGGSVDLNDGNPLLPGSEYEFLRGSDSGYAGTWGSDSGAGYLDDVGDDVAPGGQSGAKMSNAETLAGFQGLRGKQASVLRLTIEPQGTGNVTLSLPRFKRFQGHPEVRWLDGNKALMMWPNGPAVLWGAHLTYVPDEGLYWPWLPKGLGTPNTLADALQFIYAVFEMTDPGDVPAFNGESNGWYDDFEVSLRNVGSADKFSFSLLLPKGQDEKIRFGIAQTVAEVPPLACFPTYEREAKDWKADGDPVMHRYDQSQEIKYIVSPVSPLVLKNAGGGTISSSDSAPAGWTIQKYVLPLTGDEANDYGLWQGDTRFATVYPWHGWDWVGQAAEKKGKILAFLSRADGRLFRAVDVDGTVRFGVASAVEYSNWDDRDTGVQATEASLQRGKGDQVLHGLIVDGSVNVRIEASEARQAPIKEMNYGPATSHDLARYGDGTHVCARIDGGTVKLSVHNDLDLAMKAGPYSTNVTGLPDEATIRIDDARDVGNTKVILVLVGDGSDTLTYRTTDLKTLVP